GVWVQLRLVEAGRGLRAPRETVLPSSRRAGFTLKDYYIRWYREAPGGGLEWVSFISGLLGTTKEYGAEVESRATASLDNSRPEFFLSLSALQPRDSARYFCAIHTK
ncbi:HV349 protein, partial [Phaetusa simplex]|nr:HV349 protein [Phaetusa simplex]